MTNKEASFLLGASRPNGMDSTDPEFAEALAQAALDPALKGWLDDQRRFDEGIAAGLRQVTPPADLRGRILAGGRVSRPEPWFSARRLWAMAAMLMAFASLGFWFSENRFPASGNWDDEALTALTGLVSGREQFDAKSPSVADLQKWLSANGSPNTSAIPAGLKSLASLGCKTVSWQGHPISLICFHGNSGELIHLAMVDKSAVDIPPPEGSAFYKSRDGWQTASWSQGNLAMMLATRAPESQLRALFATIALF